VHSKIYYTKIKKNIEAGFVEIGNNKKTVPIGSERFLIYNLYTI